MSQRQTKDDPVTTDTEAMGDTGEDPGIPSAIGKRLRAYYDDVASEPVPDKFLSLLDALDAAEAANQSSERD